jgi:hypothetical protein
MVMKALVLILKKGLEWMTKSADGGLDLLKLN